MPRMFQNVLWILLVLFVAHEASPAVAQDWESAKQEMAEILEQRRVPGASVAIVKGNEIVFEAGIGLADVNGSVPVTKDTLFQAASISKPVASFGVLRLVDEKKLGLDAGVRKYLRRPLITNSESITLRQLLSHSAGLSVHGFGGYPMGQRLPTIEQIIVGQQPANSNRVTLVGQPGRRFQYSGGGYCVVQQVVAEVTGQEFSSVMKTLVLEPLKMEASTYQQPLPAKLREIAATGYDSRNRSIPGRFHVYPEMAAAGLWTTAGDLARFALAVQSSVEGEAGAAVSQPLAKEMMTAQVSDGPGLGLFVYGEGDSASFAHNGSNEGYRCRIAGTQKKGYALVIMTNSDNGENVFDAIESIAIKKLQQPE